MNKNQAPPSVDGGAWFLFAQDSGVTSPVTAST